MTAVHPRSSPTPGATLPDIEIRSESLGGSALARAAIAEEAPAGWYVERPHGEGWRARVESVRPVDDAWARELAPAIEARGAAAERLDRVVRSRGILVTSGQQPGLFGGPMYTWHKALTALALADEIERCTGVPAAPLFWAATDDTDYAEASWTVVAGASGAETLRMAAQRLPRGAESAMMSETPLGDVRAQLEALHRAAGSASDARPLSIARDAYVPTATVGTAYLALLRELLAPFGIAVLDASHASVAERAHPHLVRALGAAADAEIAVRERDRAIVAAGFSAQVEPVAGLSLVFERTHPGKRRIPIAAAADVARGAAPGALTSNVLLRPIIERAILPTVAYVGGPGEISYFAQSSAAAAAIGLAPPLVLPRWSGTIIEPHVRALLDGLGFELEELADPHAAVQRVARESVPPATARAAERLQVTLRDALGDLRAVSAGDGVPLPLPAIDGLERDLTHRLSRFERRLLAAVKRRETEPLARVARVRGALFPLDKRQERALNALPMLARHGLGVLDRVLERAREHARALVG